MNTPGCAEGTLEVRVDVASQELTLLCSGGSEVRWPVSTSRFGTGFEEGSEKTPLGTHRIAEKIGDGAPLGTVFVERKETGERALPGGSGNGEDPITTRILRLEGLETGVNRGEGVDSFDRCIYIHGTPREEEIGQPASHGCIRMKNRDIVSLFERVRVGTLVRIVP
jgi:lipoprotein-anchoring transpeptidase ErfK/SrfK